MAWTPQTAVFGRRTLYADLVAHLYFSI
jgi:hypothetical protein